MALPSNFISHWDHLFDNFQTSSTEFYRAVEAAIKHREVPEHDSYQIDFAESGVLSAKRVYLRVRRFKYSFDICAAPFGTGFFFTYWVTELPSQWIVYLLGLLFITFTIMLVCMKAGFFFGLFLSMILVPAVWAFIGKIVHDNGGSAEDAVLAIPIIGRLYASIFEPPTYYKVDTVLMFHESVHRAVLEVIDEMTASNGIKALSELERKPVMKSFA
ncbi:MAG TPA: hypothetical protein VMZ27_02615 [Candidatus Saccharimonadales bacterium]|nr:hypothetical protein [Candidatus Saccharimonadales bacterium]